MRGREWVLACILIQGNVAVPVTGIVLGSRSLARELHVQEDMKAKVRTLKHTNRLLWRAVDSEGLAVTECERDLGRRKHP